LGLGFPTQTFNPLSPGRGAFPASQEFWMKAESADRSITTTSQF
jgi:hypothetical protein